jgi:hypothetical protein
MRRHAEWQAQQDQLLRQRLGQPTTSKRPKKDDDEVLTGRERGADFADDSLTPPRKPKPNDREAWDGRPRTDAERALTERSATPERQVSPEQWAQEQELARQRLLERESASPAPPARTRSRDRGMER